MSSVRESYDRVAEQYALRLFDELRHKPLDREILNRFAAEVKGEVCDMGCGPGQIARYLRDRGANVFGLDLSPAMIQQAQRLNPDLMFYEGDMTALSLREGSLGGIAALYAIVNIPKESLPLIFQQMMRVLQTGGWLLLAFHIGDEVLREDELWGQPVSMDFFFFQPAEIRHLLDGAGFVVEQTIERDPYPEVEYASRRAYIWARKPAAPGD